jgi:hypothetical protein
MLKRASLNDKFKGLAAAIFTKQANASAAIKLKNALNTPAAGAIAGAGVTGGLGLPAIDTLRNSVNRLRGEISAATTNAASRQVAADTSIKEMSSLLQALRKHEDLTNLKWEELLKHRREYDRLVEDKLSAGAPMSLSKQQYQGMIDSVNYKIEALKNDLMLD